MTVTESTAPEIPSEAGTDGPPPDDARRRFDVGVLGGLASALIGLGIGATRIADNSFLTHLATGREMLAGGGVGFVREDVFTWTSGGREVVVQSWAASLLYGLVDEVAGFHGLRLLTAVLAALLAAMVWRLTRSSASIVTRVIIMAPVFVIGHVTWTERPLLIAFVLFAGVMLVVEGDGRPGWLAVAGALWVNVHGSWPLGIAYLVARAVGATIDREDGARERTALGFLGAGMLVGGVVNPYGPAMLWFPVELLGRQEVLTHVVEWQSPSFDSTWTRAFLVMVAAVVIALMRRPRWRDALPVLLFLAAALVGRRNIALSALVMVPVLARGLPAIGRLTARHTSEAVRLGVIALGGLLVAVPTVAMRGPHVDVDRFPVAAVTAMEDELGLVPGETRIIHQDFVGNYLDLRYGDARASWIDDRFELHDPELIEDYLTLLDGGPTWAEVLERYDAEAILWPTDRVLVTLAREVGGWTEAWHDESWTVLCAPGATTCSPVGDPESLAEG